MGENRKNLVVVGLTDEDLDDLRRIPDAGSYRFWPLGEYAEATDPRRCDPRRFVAAAIGFVRDSGVSFDGIIGVDDYPPSLLVPTIGRALGLRVAPLEAVFRCEHKLWSRLAQKAVAPEAVPRFALVDPERPEVAPDLPFPLWVKPVKSFLSYLGFRVNSQAELTAALALMRRELPGFAGPFNHLLAGAAPPPGWEHVDGSFAIAEELLNGRQCTLEGFVQGGRVTTLGIVDSIRFPNRVSFKRFQYPSTLAPAVQRTMTAIAEKVMAHIGFDDSLFNIEFFCDPRRRAPMIIEINSRFSPQFSDLFAMVDGISTHAVLVDLALGRKPAPAPGARRYRMAASFVLRTFEDRLVRRLPGLRDIERVGDEVPDTVVRIRASEGKWLSEWPQDSYSYRYALLNLGADSERELFARFDRCRRLLPFEFAAEADAAGRRAADGAAAGPEATGCPVGWPGD